jgi:uncharacterized protein (DUF169 family)
MQFFIVGEKMDRKRIADKWRENLNLVEQPVAIAFVESPPEGVERSQEPAPSACTFWRRGQRQLFYATAEDHSNCPIGLMTMGYPIPEEKAKQAEGLVAQMADLHYFDPAEVAHLPAIKKEHRVTVYGPLDQFPINPDLILLLITPYQMMLASEALGGATWSESPQLGAFGRPACAALPKAEQLGSATISLGCIGARTYTDLSQEEMLLVVPAAKFEEATHRLNTVIDANQKLSNYHTEQRRAVSGSK